MSSLLVLKFPYNPTGYLPSRQEFDDILSLTSRHKLTVFSDEMYRLLESDPGLRLPSVADAYENGIKVFRFVHDTFRNFCEDFYDIVMETACGLHNLRLDFRLTF